MKSKPFALLACLLAVTLAATAPAQTLTWSNPSGTVTLFGSGSRKTVLESNATLGATTVGDVLVYLEAPSSPAVSRSEAMEGDAFFLATTRLSVNESQTTGLPFTDGRIDFAATGGGSGSGFGTIDLYFLIAVPDPALIDLSGVRSAVTAAGASFTLGLFRSDASGGKFGDALLSFTENNFDAAGQYQSSQPYYLLEMNVAANAMPGLAGSAEFSYLLDLQPVVAVPEPGSGALLLGAAIAGLAVLKARRRRRL